MNWIHPLTICNGKYLNDNVSQFPFYRFYHVWVDNNVILTNLIDILRNSSGINMNIEEVLLVAAHLFNY